MKMETRIAKRIFRNVIVSLFFYALPILLMLITFYFTGNRPWEDHSKQTSQTIGKK